VEKFRSLSPQRLLFDLASRLGSLEGYLYVGEKVDRKYLPNWLRNVETAYGCLPGEIRIEIQPDYLAPLHKTHNLLRAAYGQEDVNTVKIAGMIAAVARAAGK
jgi:hypothetical protein